jgi:hypothetical protein
MDTWKLALFLALANERVVEYFIVPLFERFWKEGRWTLMYISALTGGLLSFVAKVDLMALVGLALPDPVNLLVSAAIVGGGSNLVSEVFDILKGLGSVLGEQVKDLG